MGILDRLFGRSELGTSGSSITSSTQPNERISKIYSEYAEHSINNNTEDEAYDRLANIQRGLTSSDISLFRRAAEAGDPEAMCLLAAARLEGWTASPDKKEAAHWFRKAAGAGNAVAQDTIAGFYLHGAAPSLGFNKNVAEGIRLYRLAAEQGWAKSQSTLGSFLCKDPPTSGEGLEWIKKAANQGIWSAMYNLALAYEYGEGVKKDLDLALQWYQKAAAQGLIPAKKKLEKLQAS